MTDLRKKMGVGVAWNLANMLVSRGATIVFTLFLARILAPESFGLMAMVTICYALADAVMTSGFGQAIIRQKHIEAVDLSTAFYMNLGLSALLYPLLYLTAPWVADYYEHPQLTALIRVIGVVLFINAFKVVQHALLQREMDFKSLMRINSVATVGSGLLALGMAYAGYGVWSLVAQFTAMAVISTLMLWMHSDWRPQWTFSTASLQRMFGFGSKLTLEGILNVLYENSYVLVIGKLFTPEITGLYYFAKRIRDLIVNQVNTAVQQATYPAMAQLQDQPEELKSSYRIIVQLLFYSITPGLMALAVFATPLFELALNERWLPAVPYLQLLCIAGILFPIHMVSLNMLKVKGRTDLVLSVGTVRKGLHLVLLAATAPFGMIPILVGQIVAAALSCLPYMHYSQTLLGYRYSEQLQDIFKPTVAALIAAAATWSLVSYLDPSPAITVLIGIPAYAFVYLLCGEGLAVDGQAFLKRRLQLLRLRRQERRNQVGA